MGVSKKRFLIYSLIGLVFGLLDWFYLDWLAHISWGRLGESVLVVPVIIAMNYGIWLVPLIPVLIYESKRARKIISPVLAGMLTWSCAIFSYYSNYGILLSRGKLPHLGDFNIFGEKPDAFWYYYWQMFKGIILGQFFEWVIIAILGGAILGALAHWRFHPQASAKLDAEEM